VNSPVKSSQLLKAAYRSLKKKRYSEAVIILEKTGLPDKNEVYPLFLLAIACLFTDKFNKTDSIMDRIRRIDPYYMPLLQLQAFVKLKSSSDYEDALSYYIELADEFPDDSYIIRGLKKTRKAGNFSRFQKDARLSDFVFIPGPSACINSNFDIKSDNNLISKLKGSKVIPILIAFVFLFIIVALVYHNFPFIKSNLITGKQVIVKNNSQVDMVNLGGSSYELVRKINRKKTPEFYISSDRLSADFLSAKKLIKSAQYNKALLLLNRIYSSNASFSVKEKVDFLIKFVTGIEQRKSEKIPFKKIQSRPYLYRGFSISWKGKVSNLRNRKGKSSFTLLVDFRNKDIFTGVAEVFTESIPDNIRNGDIVIVKGIFTNTLGQSNQMHLVGREIMFKNENL